MTSRSSLTVYSITLWMTFTGCRLHSEKWGTSSFHIIVHICIFSGKLHGVFQLCKCLCWSSARVPAVSVHSWCWYPELWCVVWALIFALMFHLFISLCRLSQAEDYGREMPWVVQISNISNGNGWGEGGGGGSEPHLPAWVLVAALCQDHCLSLCHSSHT